MVINCSSRDFRTLMGINCSICGAAIGQYELSFALTSEQSMFVGEDELEVLESTELKRWCNNCNYEIMLKINILNTKPIKELTL